jgi:acyl-CoA synthetase (AMP-forming)/AMP-acid ligase II
VPATLWENSRRLLPNGMLHSPYGATEALPVSSISSDKIAPPTHPEICHLLNDIPFRQKQILPAVYAGACVGQPIRNIDVKIIALLDGPIATLADAREVPAGEIGEIIVSGPVVTKTYDALPDATAAAKIWGGKDRIWHRMGDCGYLDAEGHLWFCGRKVERIETASGAMFTEPCEQVFRNVVGVTRCALIGLGARGSQKPALVVQTTVKLSGTASLSLAADLRDRARLYAHTALIGRFYFRTAFPVDVRHNAKIHRLTLAKWAATAKAFDVP